MEDTIGADVAEVRTIPPSGAAGNNDSAFLLEKYFECKRDDGKDA